MMHVIARQLDCAVPAADAVSGYTQVKMEDAPKLLNIPKSECPDVWIRLHDTSGPNYGQTLKTQWFFPNKVCTDIHLQASCGQDSSKKLYWDLDGKSTELGISVCSSKTRIILVGFRG